MRSSSVAVDFVLMNPDKPYKVTSANLLAKCHWSPFEGHTFHSSVDTTIVNGIIVFEHGELTGESVGQRLECNRAR
jgi:dihydroorotase